MLRPSHNAGLCWGTEGRMLGPDVHTYPIHSSCSTESEQVEDAAATEKARQKAKEEAKEVCRLPLLSFPIFSSSAAFRPFPVLLFPCPEFRTSRSS
jgi:hypothetical protein